MTDLIKRLEAAEAGSRELDFAIMAHFGYTNISDPRDALDCWRGSDGKSHFENATFSRSLDAALALAERVLPGWGWSAGGSRGEHYGRLDTPDGCDFEEAYASTPALALCAAILKATDTGRE